MSSCGGTCITVTTISCPSGYPYYIANTGLCWDTAGGSDSGGDDGGDDCDGEEDCQLEDPVIIDLNGDGFQLTSASQGVSFDFFGTGKKIQMSWTAAGSDDAFLVLPTASDQVVSAMQMFSNIMPQPTPATGQTRNGFAALAQYDLPQNGGNGNGIIEAGDAIFSKLRLWRDTNHNGVVDPEELLTLEQAGITQINLNYTLSAFFDMNGNLFRYGTRVIGGRVGTYAYDVILTVK
jgi:hypothetical protein